ncbi:hypothetical protein ACH4E7_10970 [Kitasatospora sp. NPDC018058]|uniref:hypothetical protein n=1 Tax=Kitasatospora sp. NPDC018058 TaxID=3364025 RepID=UPI0037BF3D10
MRTRPLLAAASLALAVTAVATVPAAAHGDTIHLDISGVQNGRVTAVATFDTDHDPVTSEFAGTLSATSADGRSAGPWVLVAVPDHPGTYTTREMLPVGHWKITVDCAFPSLGHGERELDVEAAAITDPATALAPAPTAAPATVTSTTPAAAPATVVASAPAHDTTSDATTWAALGTAAAALALLPTGFWLRRRARSR